MNFDFCFECGGVEIVDAVHLDTIVNLSCLMCGHQKSLFIFRRVGKFYQCE